MKTSFLSIFLLPALFAVLVATPFPAATVTGTAPVSAGVIAACTVQVRDPSVFSGTSTTILADGQTGHAAPVTITCTKGTVLTVAMDQGQNADAASTCTTPLRRMKSADGHFMAYDLRKGSPPTPSAKLYGCDASTTYSTTSGGAGVPASAGPTVVPTLGQDLVAGSYTDTVTVTITW
jgi:spore coat protein U-like protein